jgi:hypothetical protein
MFRVVLAPIIRSAYKCIYSIWYLSHPYCYLPLSWKSWNRFECAVGGVRQLSYSKLESFYGKLYLCISCYRHENLRPGLLVDSWRDLWFSILVQGNPSILLVGVKVSKLRVASIGVLTVGSHLKVTFGPNFVGPCTVQVTSAQYHKTTSNNCFIFAFGSAPIGLSRRK